VEKNGKKGNWGAASSFWGESDEEKKKKKSRGKKEKDGMIDLNRAAGRSIGKRGACVSS